MNKGLSLLFSLGCYALGNSLICNSALAQVTPDGTTNTTVNPDGNNNFTIENGDRAGGNLFHSFDQFSVPTNGSAVFNNAPEIENIFSRVTGGNISNIDGLIQANDANLFLVNPAGILFGNNARLDIGGSFLGTTADSILFEDGEFSATDLDNPPLLTINAPIGLNFRDNPAPIENSSSAPADFAPAPSFDDFLFGLRVSDGKTFALAGGDITADGGGIVAVGGRIELGAVGGEGTLGLNFDGDSISFNFPDDLPRVNVTLTNDAGFLVAGNSDGDITINANNINVLEGSGLFAGIFSGLGSPNAQAGDISLNATDSITLTQNSNINNNVGNFFNTATGNSGDIFIEAQNLFVRDGSAVSVTTFGEGNAGNLNIQASDTVAISGETEFPGGLFAQVDINGRGNGGNLNIETKRLSVSDGSKIQVSTFGLGNAGNLNIKAADVEVFIKSPDIFFSTGIFAETSIAQMENDPNIQGRGRGEAGNLLIETERLSVRDGGVISTSTFGDGSGGQLRVKASDSIEVIGMRNTEFASPSVLRADVIDSDVIATGQGGNLEIQTRSLNISDGGQVSTSTSSSGDAGNLNIDASDSIKIEGLDSGLFSSTGGTGNAGTIIIKTLKLQVKNNAQISVNNFATGTLEISPDGQLIRNILEQPVEGSGNAGAIDVKATNISLEDRGGIVALSSAGEGGNIELKANNLLSLRNNSEISATAGVEGTPGNGGNIDIDSKFIVAFPNGNSDITANSFNGMGGNISIATEGIFGIRERPSNNSTNDITADSLEGDGGNISINTPDINPIQGATELPTNVVEPDQTVAQACAASRNTSTANSFIVKGKGGVPPLPTAPIDPEMIMINGELVANPTNAAMNSGYAIPTSQGYITPARGVIKTEDGQIILTSVPISGNISRTPNSSINCGKV